MIDLDTSVLVVDDAFTTRKLIRQYLFEIGFETVLDARSAKEAWVMLNESAENNTGPKIKMIFCDWNMPEMSGLELLKLIRSDDYFKSMKFIIVTANRDTSKVMEAVKAGISNYIVKPFTKETILEKLETL